MINVRWQLLLGLTLALVLVSCARVGLYGGRDIRSRYNSVEQLRLAYQEGNVKALDELIAIYLDVQVPMEERLAAGRALAESHHPSALAAVAQVVSTADGLDLTFMTASIDILAGFTDDPVAAEALVTAMHTVEEKTNQLHLQLAQALGKVRTKDQILSLLDLYAVAKANLTRTENLLAETLGSLGDEQVIPVLTALARDPEVSLPVRNRAVEILGEKETADVVGAFSELLGDPATGAEVREFALNTLAGVKQEKLILALLETYNSGKYQYYSLLNTLLDALGEFDDPAIKTAVLEIATNPEYPVSLREKALAGLGRMNDPALTPRIIALLAQPENYVLYNAIWELVRQSDPDGTRREQVRRLAYQVQREGASGE